jgi:hypothetical protein
VHNLKAISATIASDDTTIVAIDDDHINRKVRGYTARSGEASSTNDFLISFALVEEIL